MRISDWSQTCALPIFQPLILRYGGPAGDDTHGSARFATDRETRPLAQNGDGLLIGRDRKSGKPLRYAGPAHLLTIAPTRTGKGVGTIIPNLLDYPGPVVCIDPKGGNARITAHYRARFGPVHVLDPFGVTGMVGAAFNPLDRIDPAGLDLADDCMTLADALVYDAPGEAGAAHWNEERSEEHTSELQSLMRTSYAASCLTKKRTHTK